MGSKNNGRKRIFLIGVFITIVSSCGNSEKQESYPDIDMLGKWEAIYESVENCSAILQTEVDIDITNQQGPEFSGVWKFANDTNRPSGYTVWGILWQSEGEDGVSVWLDTEQTVSCTSYYGYHYEASVAEFRFRENISSSDSFTDSTATFGAGCGLSIDGEMTISRTTPTGYADTNGVNIDFGNTGFGTLGLCVGYPAPGDQRGKWNVIHDVIGTELSLKTLYGDVSPLKISVSSGAMGISGNPYYRFNSLFDDFFYSSDGATWVVSITGIKNGTYSLYIYAPTSSTVPTGDMTINGVFVPGIQGEYLGFSYLEVVVTISDETLSMSGVNSGLKSGLAGLQLVPLFSQ